MEDVLVMRIVRVPRTVLGGDTMVFGPGRHRGPGPEVSPGCAIVEDRC